MKKVIIYSKSTCPYCVKAKNLFDQKKISYEEINIEQNDNMRTKMINESGGRLTVPQIFIDGSHIGGCDDLYALEKDGKLDRLLAK